MVHAWVVVKLHEYSKVKWKLNLTLNRQKRLTRTHQARKDAKKCQNQKVRTTHQANAGKIEHPKQRKEKVGSILVVILWSVEEEVERISC